MAAEVLTRRSTRASHPIRFELYDDDNVPALYIDDGSTSRPLHIEFHNESGGEIECAPADGGRASNENHHVELRFRPGILSRQALQVLARPDCAVHVLPQHADEWDVRASGSDPDESVSLYLLYKGKSALFGKDDRHTLSLHELSAASGQDARPTRVEFKLRGMRRKGATEPIESITHRHLNVFNSGRADVPLRVAFVDTSILVNDGVSENKVVLRVLNTSQDAIKAAPGTKENPEFVLHFDHGDEKEAWWVLGTADEARNGIVVQWPYRPDPVPDETKGQGRAPRWRMALPAAGLPPGGHFDVTITGLKTRGKGTTNLYFEYSGLSGYRHGRFICPMNRAPCNEHTLEAVLQTILGDKVSGDTHVSAILRAAEMVATTAKRITNVQHDLEGRLQGQANDLTAHAQALTRLSQSTSSLDTRLQELNANTTELFKAVLDHSQKIPGLQNTLDTVKESMRPRMALHCIPTGSLPQGNHCHVDLSVNEGDIVETLVHGAAIGHVYYEIRCQGQAQALMGNWGCLNHDAWTPIAASALFRAQQTGHLGIFINFHGVPDDLRGDIDVRNLQLTAKVLLNSY